jgi:hypothetical protein
MDHAPYNAVLGVVFSDEGTEPVTIDEVKSHLLLSPDLSDEDEYLNTLITAAREMCEAATNVSFIQRTVVATLNNSNNNIFLPYGPVVEVSDYNDIDGSDVEAEITDSPFPQLRYQSCLVVVTYTAGYEVIPAKLKLMVLEQIAYLYQNRGDASAGGLSPMAKTIQKSISRVGF